MQNKEEWPTQEQMAMAILILETENRDLRRLIEIEQSLTAKEIHLKMAEFKATRQFVSSN